ncbi:hypothetical protein GO496_07870 [Acidovorax citrulli]|nr:hypothetical protein [Paracidovorax citrulli]
MGDIVEPKGAQFKLPIPLIWQHDNSDPIGWVTAARVTEKGIEVEGEVAQIDDEGPLKERLTTAWQMLKAKLVRGLSVGFMPLESARIEGTYGMRYTKWLWFELSAVTVPANADASITTIKSLDNALLAATGRKQDRVVRLLPSRRLGTTRCPPGRRIPQVIPKGHAVNLQEQIKRLMETRTAKALELEGVQKKAPRRRPDQGRERARGLQGSDRRHCPDRRRVGRPARARGPVQVTKATPAAGATPAGATNARGAIATGAGPAIHMNKDADEKFKGQNYTRMVIAKALRACPTATSLRWPSLRRAGASRTPR